MDVNEFINFKLYTEGTQIELNRKIAVAILLIYFIGFHILFSTFSFSLLLKGLIALPSFLIVPIVVGQVSLKIIDQTGSILEEWRYISIFRWILGTFIMVTVFIISSVLGIFKMTGIFLFIILVIIAYYVVNRSHSNTIAINKNILVSIGIGATVLPIFYWTTSFPYIPAADGFKHYLVTQQFLSNTPYFYMPMYIPIQHSLFSLIGYIFNVDPIVFSWLLPILIYPLYGLGIFLFSFEISNNEELSLLTSLLGVYATGPIITASLVYLIPKNIIYILLPFLLAFSLSNLKEEENFYRVFNEEGGTLGYIFTLLVVLSIAFSFKGLIGSINYFSWTLLLIPLLIIFMPYVILFNQKLILIPLLIIGAFFLHFNQFNPAISGLETIKTFLRAGIVGLLTTAIFLFYKSNDFISNKAFLAIYISTTFLIITHFAEGLLISVLFITALILTAILYRYPETRSLIMIILFIGGFSLIFFDKDINGAFKNMDILYRIKESYSHFLGGAKFSLEQKHEWFKNTYSPVVLLLAILGAGISSLKRRKPVELSFLMVLLMLSGWFLLFSDIGFQSYRALIFITPFLAYFSGKAAHFISSNLLVKTKRRNVTMSILVLVLVISVIPLPHNVFMGKGQSRITSGDYEAGMYLRGIEGPVIILTENHNQKMLSSVAGKDETLTTQIEGYPPGGRKIWKQESTRKMIRSILTTTDSNEAKNLSLKIRSRYIKSDPEMEDANYYVFINQRVSDWIKNNRLRKDKFYRFKGLEKFKESKDFELVYHQKGTYLFELTNVSKGVRDG